MGDWWSTPWGWITGTSAGTWAARRLPLRPPVAILVGAIVAWVAMFAVHVHWRHDRFGTFDHDLAIWDQAVWLLSRGESFDTVRGLDVFGFHASPALYLFVPLYWLGAGPTTLTLAMTGALGLGAIAVFRAARFHLADDWHALVLALAFLVSYAGQWMVHETFHPEVMAITPLLFAYLAALEGRWRAYAGWLVLAVAWKEDVALAGLMLGLVLVTRGSSTVSGRPAPRHARRAGRWTMAACAAWFVLATRVVIPWFSEAGHFTDDLFTPLGSSPAAIAETAVTEPALVVDRLEASNPPHYAADLLASFGFVSLASPLALLLGAPQAAINLLASYDFFWTTRVHYAALPLLAVTIGAVEGVGRARNVGVRRFFLGLVAVGAFFTAVSWGVNPASPVYRDGHWPLDRLPHHDELEAAVALPDEGDGISAAYHLVPHLSHRSHIYTFPNPWLPVNWGVAGERRPDPATVEWLLLEPNLLSPTDRAVAAAVLLRPDERREHGEALPDVPAGELLGRYADPDEWEVLVDDHDLLVARRLS